MSSIRDAVEETADGCILRLRIIAGSRKTILFSEYDPWRKTIVCRIGAPAMEGLANRELIRGLSHHFNIPEQSIVILSGSASQLKRVLLRGICRARALEAIGAG